MSFGPYIEIHNDIIYNNNGLILNQPVYVLDYLNDGNVALRRKDPNDPNDAKDIKETKQQDKKVNYSISQINDMIQLKDNRLLNALSNSLNILYRSSSESILMIACQYGALGCVQYLLENKVELNYFSINSKSTALMHTVLHCHKDKNRDAIVHLLLVHGADPLIKDHNGYTAFDLAVKNNQLSLVAIFLDLGYDPTISLVNGQSPLIRILQSKSNDQNINQLGKLLVQRGVKLPLKYVDPTTGDKLLHLLSISDTDFLEDVLANDDEQIVQQLHEPNKRGLTPFLLALTNNKHNNIRRFHKYMKPTPVESSIFYEIALQHNAVQSLYVLHELNYTFSSRQNWLEFFISMHVRNGNLVFNDDILDIIFKMDPTPDNKNLCLYTNESNCNCSFFTIMVRNLHLDYVDSMLSHGIATATLNCACEQHGTLLQQLFIYGRHKNISISPQEDLIYDILDTLLKAGLNPNDNVDHLSTCTNTDQLRLLLSYNTKITKNITSYPTFAWKTLTLHINMNINKIVYGTEEDIEDIDDNDFLILHNGIVWDFKSFLNYLTSTVKGKNEYDSKSPWPNQVIWTQYDVNNIKKSLNPNAKAIIQFMNVSELYYKIPKNFIDIIKFSSSIFWARGEEWDNTIKTLFTPDEMSNWNEQKHNLADTYMPLLKGNLTAKIEKLKQEQLYHFQIAYLSLDEDITRNVLPRVLSFFNIDFMDRLFRGKECIMETGRNLSKAYERLTSWMVNK